MGLRRLYSFYAKPKDSGGIDILKRAGGKGLILNKLFYTPRTKALRKAAEINFEQLFKSSENISNGEIEFMNNAASWLTQNGIEPDILRALVEIEGGSKFNDATTK